MLKSMTGYGSATFEDDRLLIKTEIKSVNNKFLEVNLRIPRILQSKDASLRNIISKLCERGTVALIMVFQQKQITSSTTAINKNLLESYIKEIKQVSDNTGVDLNPLINNAWQLPEVLVPQETDLSEADWQLCEKLINQAFEKFDQFRVEDGKELVELFNNYISHIESLLAEINEIDKLRIERVRERIKNNLETVIQPENIDPVRYEQELIYYIEKLDISEEKVRLAKHCKYFKETLLTEGSGKKLNFISQEMGREINTIGSKANDFDIQQKVVMMKDDLEKIKEQTMNIV
ncbi:MAG: YicC family protein [Bacteroidetes bacterium]|nr:YicC family protein [Bacteroidota bacterium]